MREELEQETNKELHEKHRDEIQDLKEEIEEKDEQIQELTIKFDNYLKDHEQELVQIKDQF